MTANVFELDDTRRQIRDRLRAMPHDGDPRAGVRRMRALLEEMGVKCDDTAELEDADAILLTSGRGMEALVAYRLNDGQRHQAYSRIVARLIIGQMHEPMDAKIEYQSKHFTISRQEKEEDAAVAKFAIALAGGNLDLAPRPLYEDVPKLTLAFTPRSAARSTLGGMHLWSDYWYRRSTMYRWWRSRRDVSSAIKRVCVMLNPRHPAAA
ncbi:MAG TPA: hypothetical protein VJP07_02210 [Dehalococcoidia bacterium]|nr:hypothetical protein [Dehalococcoidia bacterium]